MPSPLSLVTWVGFWLVRTVNVDAFSLSTSNSRPLLRSSASDTTGDAGPTRTKPMSPEEIKARMGLSDDDDEPPKLFSDSLYSDIQHTLLTLEKRIKEGPGSLSMLEVEEFSAETQRIAVEMRFFEAGRVDGLANAQIQLEPTLPSPVSPVASSDPVAELTAASSSSVAESEDDGPAYEGTGGLGMAKDTRNTYILPGMNEMTSEEYREALNQSIVARQKERQAAGGYGNRATWDYLNHLSGDRGVLKKEEDDEQP